MTIELGQKVKDTVTGFTGIATATTTYLHGCRRIAVQPKVDKDGNIPECQVFDEPQLECLGKKPKVKSGERDTGGPHSGGMPARNTIPARRKINIGRINNG
ncbi:hypothetical protein LCGC14_1635920 [marine sediment metagenome]|uniref:Uncharacterized protein n=1 Tax=marine sediment metagenome TaxID=412755 RepID=A0A0F9I172_9ZZZZ